MAKKWTQLEEQKMNELLNKLYIQQNLTIKEIAPILGIKFNTVYDRLIRLGIPTKRDAKLHCNNQRSDIVIPTHHSNDLAEFVGIMLGDGHITSTQVMVTLGKKDCYTQQVAMLIDQLFHVHSKVSVRREGYETVYVGSTKLSRWLIDMGLVYNKTKMQVDIPKWVFQNSEYMKAVVRGLFDTDGSVSRLSSGSIQISFCNRSSPLLSSVQRMLQQLEFNPSRISNNRIYLTRRVDIQKYMKEIGFRNQQHNDRYLSFL